MFDFLHTMQGPDFLILYAVWFVVAFGTVFGLRRARGSNRLIDLAGAAAFLGLGIARFVIGSAHGLEKWDFLIMMMVFGSVAFFLRVTESSGGSSSDGSSSSSSCSSGSSGGGCGGGGGGCGGCGGS